MTTTEPILVIRNTVLFPHMVMPLTAGRARSLAAVEAALESDRIINVFTQPDPSLDEPGADDLHPIGTRALIQKANRGQNGYQLVLQGQERVRLLKLEPGSVRARVQSLAYPDDQNSLVEALQRDVLELSAQLLTLASQAPREAAAALVNQLANQFHDPILLAYFVAGQMKLDTERELKVLSANSRQEALELIHRFLVHELEVQKVRQSISNQVQSEMSKDQRQYLLKQQLRAIQKELGEADEDENELAHLREKLAAAELPEEVRKEADRELRRLEKLSPSSPDHSLTRTYLELLSELPWNATTDDNHDLNHARRVLDEDHHGLDEIKQRILEHLAVMKLNGGARSPILLLVGPPGVGKTSLGQSIARTLGRKFERLSLGGLHDEAELRGHRRTYVGALPGRLIQAVRRAGVKNPVLLLDEVDKLGNGYRGDPAAALLEILDPAQNDKFRDNYLDLPFDLSKTLFILTANTLDTIPRPLLDRTEVIRLSGYSEEEKLPIARRYLLPRILREAGLNAEHVHLSDDNLNYLISRYTREAGVRQLERGLARLARKLALRIAQTATSHGSDNASPDASPNSSPDVSNNASPKDSLSLDNEQLSELLGPERYDPDKARKDLAPGVATGLAWTEAGGDVLYIETLTVPDRKGLTLTGQLGDVMKESAQTAQSHILARASRWGVNEKALRGGVHIHIPAGAIPKDGPSAGITMAVSLASNYARVSVRKDLAMTGELTLTGLVLPVGGIKEKVLAARRAGIRTIILPRDNRKDLRDIPSDVLAEMEIHLVENLEEVLRIALPGLKRRQETGLSKTA